ncbi:hypothetical protein G7046_g6512 [Stylonectria norvegica]|nr:hypothetical protein G7046_g6512 [Stylonectria norvegica]
MDPTSADGSRESLNSPLTRSTSGNRASVGRRQFGPNLDISASPQSLPLELAQSSTSSPENYTSTAYLSPPTGHSAYFPTPSSQPYPPFPVLSPADLDSNWSQSDQIPDATPSLRFQPPEPLPSRPRQIGRTTSMSTVALQYDPSFSVGSRSAFTWPGHLEQNGPGHSMLGHNLSSMDHRSETNQTPSSAPRSLTSSPPRLSLTAEQRELKRQQDRVRRDSRITTRMRRTSSQSYADSPPPAMAMPDATSAINLPVYTTAPAPMSLLSEPTSAPSYLPYSPSLEDQQQAHATQVYPSAYQSNMQPNYSMSMEYSAVYAGPGHYSTRPTSMPVGQDVGMMYQVPAIMTSGGAGPQDGGHVRVVQSRPKPRCWEHGCNGRQFSTFSNLLRHQREKSGQAAKASLRSSANDFAAWDQDCDARIGSFRASETSRPQMEDGMPQTVGCIRGFRHKVRKRQKQVIGAASKGPRKGWCAPSSTTLAQDSTPRESLHCKSLHSRAANSTSTLAMETGGQGGIRGCEPIQGLLQASEWAVGRSLTVCLYFRLSSCSSVVLLLRVPTEYVVHAPVSVRGTNITPLVGTSELLGRCPANPRGTPSASSHARPGTLHGLESLDRVGSKSLPLGWVQGFAVWGGKVVGQGWGSHSENRTAADEQAKAKGRRRRRQQRGYHSTSKSRELRGTPECERPRDTKSPTRECKALPIRSLARRRQFKTRPGDADRSRSESQAARFFSDRIDSHHHSSLFGQFVNC